MALHSCLESLVNGSESEVVTAPSDWLPHAGTKPVTKSYSNRKETREMTKMTRDVQDRSWLRRFALAAFLAAVLGTVAATADRVYARGICLDNTYCAAGSDRFCSDQHCDHCDRKTGICAAKPGPG